MTYANLHDWIRHEAISCTLDVPDSFNAAVDQFVASISDAVELLGLGETLHGGEDILILRNQLFQRLAEKHGYTAITVESSFPKGHLANQYIMGQTAASLEQVLETGFSHGFGKFDANRKLIEWMHRYNADSAHQPKLHFYGFDSPTEMYSTDSPRQLLTFALDYLTSLDSATGQRHRQQIESSLGDDAAWENPAALMDPSQSIGISPAAVQVRIATEELIADLVTRRPEWIARSDRTRYLEALHYASMARHMLNYHAALARQTEDRFVRLLGLRDAMMADTLLHIIARERGRGKVFAFAHNSHLKRGRAEWQLGPDLHSWWPAGAHLDALCGAAYVVIGTALGVSEDNGIGQPEVGTLESALLAAPGPVRLVPTHAGEMLPPSLIASLPARSASQKNTSYFPLTAHSFTDFDWLCALDSTTYCR